MYGDGPSWSVSGTFRFEPIVAKMSCGMAADGSENVKLGTMATTVLVATFEYVRSAESTQRRPPLTATLVVASCNHITS
jgi:hypothetical protein